MSLTAATSSSPASSRRRSRSRSSARVRQACERVPAIAVSAYARPEERRRALAAGYDAYCCKPIETATFLHTVRDVLFQYEQSFLKHDDRLIGRQGLELA